MNRHHDSRSRGNREGIRANQIAHAHSGTAQPVPLETRARLEPLFQHNFGDVRIYSDAAATSTADALHAKAFTVGQDIAFGAGRYDPHSPHGQRLLMHELAHTVQQQRAAPNNRAALEVSGRDDPLERNANAMVSSLGRGSSPMPAATSSGLAVQCEDVNEPEVGYNLDPSNLNAYATIPVADGTAGVTVDTSGAGMNYQNPALTAGAGYNWGTGPYAQGQYQIDPAHSVGAQANDQGASAYFNTPALQLNGGVTNGYQDPYVNAHLRDGDLSADLGYNPADGLHADARLQLPNGSLTAGTSGVALEQQFGPVDLSLATNLERLEAEAKLRQSIMGQPIDITGNAGIGLNGTNPSIGVGVTAPNPLGLPISPTIGVDISQQGVHPNVGLGIQQEF